MSLDQRQSAPDKTALEKTHKSPVMYSIVRSRSFILFLKYK